MSKHSRNGLPDPTLTRAERARRALESDATPITSDEQRIGGSGSPITVGLLFRTVSHLRRALDRAERIALRAEQKLATVRADQAEMRAELLAVVREAGR